ncbi:hypothetical protein Pogu_2082 [Pyrobaculum oguniense TE7]|uniref:Uncharacterized protein n=1 Tax=Pyrobaculum oguniense (strain DSM 13380 / JCM 10595 / TE7) TaxID=698757 RepID=H6QCR3_PYROT|nr:hypothetical protein Pogu_2082 [Pyrobaculum oguniense TE7]
MSIKVARLVAILKRRFCGAMAVAEDINGYFPEDC